MRNLPNVITISRIFASIIVPILILLDGDALRYVALILFIVAGISDWFDGYLARKLDAVSNFGRMIDPISDKLLIAGTMIALAAIDGWGWLMVIPAIAILLREIFISGLREWMITSNVIIHVTSLSKMKTFVQLNAVGFSISVAVVPLMMNVAIVLMWGAAILTIITGWDYLKKALSYDSSA